MILGHSSNIDIYSHISDDLFNGLKFIKEVEPDVPLGTIELNSNIKVMITEYETGKDCQDLYEAHRKYIDIQYPIKGYELIKWCPVSLITLIKPYNPSKDVLMFSNDIVKETDLIIGNGIFAVFFPEDGHSPQHFVGQPELIKKITIKVRI